METKEIDVLMATYNSNYTMLEKQIKSILNQTYKKINLIISDDNSSNNTKMILQKYEQLPNVRIYYQKQNLGYIKNFEFLLNKSCAPYIAFCDHDDIWYKEKIQKSIETLESKKVSLVYCNCRQIDENDNVITSNYFKAKNMPIVYGKSNIANSRYLGIGCSQVFTKEVKDAMLPFKESVLAHDFLASYIANNLDGVFAIIEPLFDYRLHSSNVFGGRTLSSNLKRFKEKDGSSYSSYLKYRNETVIDKAYLNMAIMCNDYIQNDELLELISYLEKIKESKYINLDIKTYLKHYKYKGTWKQQIKEIAIFCFPVFSYIKFKIR